MEEVDVLLGKLGAEDMVDQVVVMPVVETFADMSISLGVELEMRTSPTSASCSS